MALRFLRCGPWRVHQSEVARLSRLAYFPPKTSAEVGMSSPLAERMKADAIRAGKSGFMGGMVTIAEWPDNSP